MREKGRLSSVMKVEMEILQAVPLAESVADLRNEFIELLRGQQAWEEDIETALERCGMNIKLEQDGESLHI